jgi:crotonobetainyl-CoA:carnitine CoA-transferase CaiB-like acyl-CoA transferase
MMALRHAERTGQGQHIDISLLDTQIAMLANQSMNWLVGGVVPGRLGNRHPTVVPYKTFEVADGSIIIAVGNDGQFALLCRELGVPELITDPRFANSRARLVNRDAIEGIVQDLVRGFDGAALIDRLVAKGVPAGPVNTIKDIFEDPFVEARGTVHRFEREGETPARFDRPPPRLGEHSAEILRDWLALGDDELERLAGAGVVEQRKQGGGQ